MSERSDWISRLLRERDFRSSYLRGKLNVLISAQIRALRKKTFGTQTALAEASNMKQSRISAMEQPGATKFNLETLIRLASTFKVALVVKFVPYSEMLRWDNRFVQDEFDVIKIDKDEEFLTPTDEHTEEPLMTEGQIEGRIAGMLKAKFNEENEPAQINYIDIRKPITGTYIKVGIEIKPEEKARLFESYSDSHHISKAVIR